jgi:hypothetical protein
MDFNNVGSSGDAIPLLNCHWGQTWGSEMTERLGWKARSEATARRPGVGRGKGLPKVASMKRGTIVSTVEEKVDAKADPVDKGDKKLAREPEIGGLVDPSAILRFLLVSLIPVSPR